MEQARSLEYKHDHILSRLCETGQPFAPPGSIATACLQTGALLCLMLQINQIHEVHTGSGFANQSMIREGGANLWRVSEFLLWGLGEEGKS